MEATGSEASVDLSGTWRAAPCDEGLRRRACDPGLADEGWTALAVPGHWQANPALATEDGPVLYRRRLARPDPFGPGARDGPDGDRRTWLVLDGVFSSADVWVDGTYLLDVDGWFFPHEAEVTELLAVDEEHVLAVEVACARPVPGAPRRDLLGAYGTLPVGAFAGADGVERGANPGGLWRAVRLEQSGPVRIRHWRTWCTTATAEEATVAVRLVLDAREVGEVTLRTSVGGVTDLRRQHLAAGENRVELVVAVPEPSLWWPWSLGPQPLEDVVVEVVEASGRLSDRRRRRIGLRSVAMRDWALSVNGERLFLKGARQGPTLARPAEADPALVAGDVALARDAGLDLLRVHAHVARPELYDAADEAGLLLWQDLPLQGTYQRGVRAAALRQAREAVDLLAHHPSVVLWCAHDEPDGRPDLGPTTADPRRERSALAVPLRRAASGARPSWNRMVLDHALARVLERTDGSRPVVASSGVLPRPPGLDGTDSHLFPGWEHGDARDLAEVLRAWPRLGRFVGAFGARSVPGDGDLLDDAGSGGSGGAPWPAIGAAAVEDHRLDVGAFERFVPPARFATRGEWAAATRRYQATLVRRQVEVLRRLRFRPCGGFTLAGFADAGPEVGFSVLDHHRRPKEAYAALAEACAPVIVTADPLPAVAAPGARLEPRVHVVSDRREPLEGAVVDLVARLVPADDGPRVELGRRRWAGDVPPDACVAVGGDRWDLPNRPGRVEVELVLRAPDGAGGEVVATNAYDVAVAVAP